MKRIYIAGAYSADNVITVLDNMREGMRLATRVFLLGYAPFVPWFDFHFQLMLRENEILTVEDYYRYSIGDSPFNKVSENSLFDNLPCLAILFIYI